MIWWTSLVFIFCFQTIHGMNEVRWCTISDQENKKCNDMKSSFAQAQIIPLLSCVSGQSSSDCIQKLANNQADAVTLDGSLIYDAGKQYNLKPIVGEVYDQGVGTSYYAVAVVQKSSNITINSMKGAKSCHTGIERTAGWKVPLGYLIDTGRMSVMGCNVQRAVSNFFSKSCVPGVVNASFPSLCELCIGDGNGQNVCQLDSREQYYDYSGAFRCLAESKGDVAFVKHSTVFDNSDGKNPAGWAKDIVSADYQLLCRDGTRAEVSEWRRCNLAKVPARAVVTRPDVDSSVIYNILHEGQQRFKDGSTFKMFDSSTYGGSNLLFKDSTLELRPIFSQTYQAWLGDEFLQAMWGINCNPDKLPKMLRWCTISTSEIWKCADMGSAFLNMTLSPYIQCVSAESPEDCMKMIQKKEIDAVTLDGGDIYKAGKTYNLVPAAGESYLDSSIADSYYAVAVVHKNPSDAFTINELKGRKSCHTGYQRTAGWNVPVGTLVKNGFIRPEGCNIAQAVADFFSSSCVPGINQKSFPKLCQLCKNKCESSESEPYFGYSGAFRCLAERAGEVAFVKHSTVFENTDGKSTQDWAKNLESSKFQLLCPNGARAEVTQFADCNWAQVPAHAVMVHADTNIHAVFGLLDHAQEYYGSDSHLEFKMFDSSKYNSKDLIFKDSTNKIVPVKDKKTAEKWLGTNYINSLEGLQCSSSTVLTPVNAAVLLFFSMLLIKISV
ncbi:melanotransferrin isoform X2 [Pelobates cultripes]|uniref:Melanotransferrin n=1 Tax=Pelobates cultripes TaxID=61616 RepID=A0AAD1RBY2_PELCU|nr:melanotransferrin isoform X2 [Pelobates cultripes]